MIHINSNLNSEHFIVAKREIYDLFPIESDPPYSHGPICNGRTLHYNEIGDDTNYLNYAGVEGDLNNPLSEEDFFNPAFSPSVGSQTLVNDIELQMTQDVLTISANLSSCVTASLVIFDYEPGGPDELAPPGTILNHTNIEQYYPYDKIAEEYHDDILPWLYTGLNTSPVSSLYPLSPTAPYRVDVQYKLPNGETTSINTINFEK